MRGDRARKSPLYKICLFMCVSCIAKSLLSAAFYPPTLKYRISVQLPPFLKHFKACFEAWVSYTYKYPQCHIRSSEGKLEMAEKDRPGVRQLECCVQSPYYCVGLLGARC